MKKILFLPLLFLMTASFSDLAAQRSRYQGEIQVGFGAGVGSNPFLSLNRVTVDVVNGIRVNSYFSIGLGLGYHTYLGRTIEGIDFTDEHIVPVYANLKGYMPAGRSMFRGFVSLDAGYGFSMESDIGGFLITPALGACIGRNVTFSVGYQSQNISSGGLSVSFGAVLMRIGALSGSWIACGRKMESGRVCRKIRFAVGSGYGIGRETTEAPWPAHVSCGTVLSVRGMTENGSGFLSGECPVGAF